MSRTEKERARERERERNIDVREKHWSVASHMGPNRGLNPQLSVAQTWLGIKPATFWCTRWRSNQLSHLAKAVFFFVMYIMECSLKLLLKIHNWWLLLWVYGVRRVMYKAKLTTPSEYEKVKKEHFHVLNQIAPPSHNSFIHLLLFSKYSWSISLVWSSLLGLGYSSN